MSRSGIGHASLGGRGDDSVNERSEEKRRKKRKKGRKRGRERRLTGPELELDLKRYVLLFIYILIAWVRITMYFSSTSMSL